MTKVIPQWIKDKQAMQSAKPEQIIVIGKMGVDGVINGRLPNGDVYHRNIRKKR
jgi:hypothetical protein